MEYEQWKLEQEILRKLGRLDYKTDRKEIEKIKMEFVVKKL